MFDNIYLELIWVDSTVATSEVAGPLREATARAAAWRTTGASPFGAGLRQVGDGSDFGVPTHRYSPEWMRPGTAISLLRQPDEPDATEVFVVPSYLALTSWVSAARQSMPQLWLHPNEVKRATAVTVHGPRPHRPMAADHLVAALLEFGTADAPVMTLAFDGGAKGVIDDLRPLLPLVIRR